SGLSQNSKLFSEAFNHCRSSARLRSSSSDRTVYTVPGETLSTFSSGLNTPLENSTLMLIYKVRLFFITLAVTENHDPDQCEARYCDYCIKPESPGKLLKRRGWDMDRMHAVERGCSLFTIDRRVPKLDVAGSIPVSPSLFSPTCALSCFRSIPLNDVGTIWSHSK